MSDITLEVREGERIAVVGHNGSGKSTLVRILGALQIPLQGVCLVLGRDVREVPFRELRRRVGVVFQSPESQIVGAVVEDDVAFAPENLGVPAKEIETRITEALDAVGMSEFRHATPTRLSGGQKQRIAIAGILALRPEILILDESTAMLDPKGRAEVMDIVRSLNKNGMTVIDITH